MHGAVRARWTLIAMCCGLFMVMLDATIVNTALPTIQRDLGMSVTELQWINNAYTLVIGALVITAGRLGDVFGRRRFFIVGMIVFAASSASAGVSQGDLWLIVSRASEGIGAAFMIPLSLSIVSDAFTPAERGRAIGVWAGISGLALAVGPLLGGVLSEDASWRWIFFVNVPVGVLGVALTRWAVRESRDPQASRRVDVAGVFLVSCGLAAIVLGTMQGRAWGWGSAATIACLAGGAALLLAFLAVERRQAEPLLDTSLFRSRTFVGSNISAFLVSFGMLGAFFFIPLYMQNVLGYSPIESGLGMLPVTVLVTATSPVAGRLVDRVGARKPMVAGFLLMTVAFLALSGIDDTSGYSRMWPAFVVLGVGMGLVMSPMSTAVMSSVPPRNAGAASGVQNMNRQVGGTFGIAVLGALFGSLLHTRLEDEISAGGLRVPPSLLADQGANPEQAVAAVEKLPPEQAGPLLDAGRDAFVHALANTFRVAAAVCLAGAVVAALLIRRQELAQAGGPLVGDGRTVGQQQV